MDKVKLAEDQLDDLQQRGNSLSELSFESDEIQADGQMNTAKQSAKTKLTEDQLADAERLRELVISKVKTTAKEFAIKCDLGSPSIFSHHVRGNKPISLEALLKYARGLNVPPSAISPTMAQKLEGLLITKKDQDDERKVSQFVQQLASEIFSDKEVKDAIKNYLSSKIQKNKLTNNEGVKMLPLLAIEDAILDQEGREEKNLKTHAITIGCSDFAFMVKVPDNSCSPFLDEGYLIIVDPEMEIKPGCFVLASVDGVEAPVLRRYKEKTIDEFELSALNDDYPSYGNKNNYIKIIGGVHTSLCEF